MRPGGNRIQTLHYRRHSLRAIARQVGLSAIPRLAEWWQGSCGVRDCRPGAGSLLSGGGGQ